jgi:hypothetical protein
MSDWTPPRSFLRVYDQSNGVWRVMAHEESKIDAAVTKWVEKHADSLLHLELVEGGEAVSLASDVRSWCLSSPEIRERGRQFDAMLAEEEKASGWVDPV